MKVLALGFVIFFYSFFTPLSAQVKSEAIEPQETIAAQNFEYDLKESSLTKMKDSKLIELAKATAWDLKTQTQIRITKVKVKELDNIESTVTFYTEKGSSTTIHAYAKNSEIYGSQGFENIKGELGERDWVLEFRTVFSVVFVLLMVAPIVLFIVIPLLLFEKSENLDNIVYDYESGTIQKKRSIKGRKSTRTLMIYMALMMCSLFTLWMINKNHDENFIGQPKQVQTTTEEKKETTHYLEEDIDYVARQLKRGDNEGAILWGVLIYAVAVLTPIVIVLKVEQKE